MSTPVLATKLPAALARRRRLQTLGAFAVVYLVWGSTFLGIRVAVETLPPLSMAAVRFLISGAVMLLATARSRPRPTLRQWGNAVVVGALFFLGNHGLMNSAARYIPSSIACIIIATEVPVIAVLSSFLLPNQPLTARSLWGALLGVTGVVVLIAGQAGGPGALPLLPCLAVVGASLSWSSGAVISQRLSFPPDPLLRAAMQMSCGGVLLTLAALVRGEPLDPAAFSARSLLALGYLIAFGSVLAFGCYTFLLKHVRTDAVATHVFVNPLVAVAVGVWLGGERLAPIHLVGGAFILAAVVVITRRPPVKAVLAASEPAGPSPVAATTGEREGRKLAS
jgi:drug/metabolite transporter (DMT)-like permease